MVGFSDLSPSQMVNTIIDYLYASPSATRPQAETDAHGSIFNDDIDVPLLLMGIIGGSTLPRDTTYIGTHRPVSDPLIVGQNTARGYGANKAP